MNKGDFHVLIVDDERELAEITAESFTLEGLQGSYCCSGKEALAILKKQKVDVIIADAHMPEMKGMELLEKIPEPPQKRPLFYLWTGDSDLKEKTLTTRGVKGVIIKPSALDDLIGRVVKDLKNLQEI